MHRVLLWIAVVVFSAGPLLGENFYPTIREAAEPEMEVADIWSIGVSTGPSIFLGDTVDFTNVLFNNPVVIQDVEEQQPGFSLQLFSVYGLDRFLLPGISVGLKLGYSYANIEDVELDAFEGGIQVFEFDDELLKVHTISLVPVFELRFFSLLEHLLEIDLPPFWEIYLQAGLRLHYNIYDDEVRGIDLEDLEAFSLGAEVATGVEFFLSDHWSVRWELAFTTNSSEFDIVERGLNGKIVVFTADLDLYELRTLVGVNYYF